MLRRRVLPLRRWSAPDVNRALLVVLLLAPAGACREQGPSNADVVPRLSAQRMPWAPAGEGDAATTRPPSLQVVPPALVWHGAGADAFDDAIAPWQAGNYAGAAVRLDALAAAHPDNADLQFYRGTAWLLAGVARNAVAPLRGAAAMARGSRRHEAFWYLGLALYELGRTDEAAGAFDTACGEHAPRACLAAAHLRGATTR